MINNNLIVLVKADGSLLSQPIGRLRANNNYTSTITVVSPVDLKNVVSITFDKRNRVDSSITQYLIPNGKLKGKDILDKDNPFYQDIYDWNVFEAVINKKALAYIAKYRAGILFTSVSVGETIHPINAINYLGKFGIESPISEYTEEFVDGDYFICNSYNYHEENILWTLDDYAYYYNEKWNKSNYKGVLTTGSFEIGVDPSLPVNIEVEADEDLAVLLAGNIAVIEDNITNLQTTKVDKTTTVNAKGLDQNITLHAHDIRFHNPEEPILNNRQIDVFAKEALFAIGQIETLLNFKVDETVVTDIETRLTDVEDAIGDIDTVLDSVLGV